MSLSRGNSSRSHHTLVVLLGYCSADPHFAHGLVPFSSPGLWLVPHNKNYRFSGVNPSKPCRTPSCIRWTTPLCPYSTQHAKGQTDTGGTRREEEEEEEEERSKYFPTDRPGLFVCMQNVCLCGYYTRQYDVIIAEQLIADPAVCR